MSTWLGGSDHGTDCLSARADSIRANLEVVQRLLASTAGDHAVDIRDRAILMLLAVYGLRSEEVRGLQLEDLDWDRELINIGRPKTRRIQQYPLASTVGDAILRYLREVRRHRPSRHVFLTLRVPTAL